MGSPGGPISFGLGSPSGPWPFAGKGGSWPAALPPLRRSALRLVLRERGSPLLDANRLRSVDGRRLRRSHCKSTIRRLARIRRHGRCRTALGQHAVRHHHRLVRLCPSRLVHSRTLSAHPSRSPELPSSPLSLGIHPPEFTIYTNFTPAPAVSKLWTPSLFNPAFALYEFAGFQGVGLPRDELRALALESGTIAVLRGSLWHIPGLALLAALLVFFFLGRSGKRGKSRLFEPRCFFCVTVFITVLACTFVLAICVGFPFWGRHVAPVFPFYFLILLLGVASCSQNIPDRFLSRSIVCGAFVLFLTSSAIARWHPLYGRDDYRGACAVARQALAAGQRVWWNAAAEGPSYYHLPASKSLDDLHKAFLLDKPTEESLAPLAPPDLIVTSKADIFDPSLILNRYCETHGYLPPVVHLKSFTI